MNLRLLFIHVERGAGDQTLGERPCQRGLINHRASRGVDQVRSPLHPRERLLIDQVFGLRRHRTVQRDDVGGREQPIERHLCGVGDIGNGARRIGDRHAERRRLIGHRAPNPAKAHQTELLAPQLHTQHVIERPATPRTGANHAFALAKAPRNRQDQRPGEVGAGIRQDVRCVGDRDAARAARCHVDVVIADGDVGDDLQTRPGGVEHRGVDRVGQQAHDGIDTGDALQQFIARNRGAAGVQIDLANRFKLRDDRRRKFSGD